MIEKYFPKKKFAALLFDFDGTIADTMPAHFQAWNKALDTYGLTLSLEQHFKWAGRPTREILKLLAQEHQVDIPFEAFSKAKEEHYFNSIATVQGILPIIEIIKSFHGKVLMAVVSGSRHKPIEATMKQLNLTKYFSAIIAAEDYINGKPAPDCFLQAALALNIQPQDCLVFEDAELGIQAAEAAGMACLRVVQTTESLHELTPVFTIKK